MKKNKASVLAVSLIILGIVLVSALTFSLATLEQRKASIGSSHSDQAYQNAESGVEEAMSVILEFPSSSVGSLGYSCSGSGSIATYTSSANHYIIQLKKSDSSGESYITDCSTKASEVADIKSVGMDIASQNTRAIEAAVAMGTCSSGIYQGKTSPHNGAAGGYTGANNLCSQAFPSISGIHVCSANEILNSINCGGKPLDSGWYSAGTFGVNSGAKNEFDDCVGWTSSASSPDSGYGAVGFFWNTSKGDGYPDRDDCNQTHSFLCCK